MAATAKAVMIDATVTIGIGLMMMMIEANVGGVVDMMKAAVDHGSHLRLMRRATEAMDPIVIMEEIGVAVATTGRRLGGLRARDVKPAAEKEREILNHKCPPTL